MGGGAYLGDRYKATTKSMGYDTKGTSEIFSQSMSSDMNPIEILIRESRDSAEHPESFPIILALDVTGSMGMVPTQLIKEGLPTIMGRIIESSGIKDPQLLFVAVGDHKCDRAPLQVGQFESSDELLHKWLSSVWVEGRGGGNGGESYMLPWYLAAFHTSVDSFIKRGKKGILITVGDEPVHSSIDERSLRRIFKHGENQKDYSSAELLAEARKTWVVKHIHAEMTAKGSESEILGGWKEIMGQDVVSAHSLEEIPVIISDMIAEAHGGSVNKVNAPVTGAYGGYGNKEAKTGSDNKSDPTYL